MIIDCHSHVGYDYYCGDINIEDYIIYCKQMGIEIGFLMPSPWPKYIDSNGCKITSLLWEHDNQMQRYYFSLSDDKKEVINKNPYEKVNEQYYEMVSSNDGEICLKFIPMVHGVLDDPDYLDNLFYKLKPIAIKFHGFGSGFSPEDINPDIVEVIKKYNLPIIIHTSVYNYNYGYGADTRYWRNKDHPMKWIKFLNHYDLKGVLNHGACLNEDALKEVNDNDNLMIGIGPDLDISLDYFKVDVDKSIYERIGYLKFLKDKIYAEKLLFDIDFNWNRCGNGLDYGQVDRLARIWSSKDMELILSKNAINYYELKNIKTRKLKK